MKIDPAQIKSLLYVAIVILSGSGILETVQTGKVEKKIDAVQQTANSLVETNAARAKQMLEAEVDSLKKFIDALKLQTQAELQKATLAAQQEMVQFKTSVDNRLQNTKEHTHLFGQWSAPQQMDGNFIQPQFYQTRECKICGEAELKKAPRP